MNVDVSKMELVAGKGRVSFVTKKEDGTTDLFSHFGRITGKAKWCKVLEPDQYDNYAVDIFTDLTHIKEEIETIAQKTKELTEAAGKKVNGIQDYIKETNDGEEYVQFKRKGTKGDGTANTPPKIYDVQGRQVEGWDKLIGNGSQLGVAYMLSPYYMASTKMVGVSIKFYAVQVIKLEEYTGSTNNSPFANESGEEAPFDTEESEY